MISVSCIAKQMDLIFTMPYQSKWRMGRDATTTVKVYVLEENVR